MSDWNRLGVFDLETTGLDVTQSRIVTAFIGVLDSSGALVESTEWVADPGIEMARAFEEAGLPAGVQVAGSGRLGTSA